MSHDPTIPPAVAPTGDIRARMDNIQRLALLVGAGGLGLTLLLALIPATASTALPAYLVGYIYWVGIALGCLGLTSIYHLVGGSWGVPVRRIMEAGGLTIIPLAVLFLPIALGMKTLYIWTDHDFVAHHEAVEHKAAYLNTSFFLVRALLYFLIWSGIAALYRGMSLRQDQRTDQRPSELLRGAAGPILTVLFLSWTFASIDWMMSREPEWPSTMFGVLSSVGALLKTLAMLIVVSYLLRNEPLMRGVVTPNRLHDLGNLMLAFTMLWAYMSFSQFLIIWAGNLPEEIPYYLRRGRGVATWIALALAIFHFFVPFFILLIRQNKRRADKLVLVAGWMLFMRWVNLCWVILPAEIRDTRHPYFPWMEMLLSIPALFGVGGISVAAFLTLYKTRPWIPVNDPRVNKALEHSGG